jgi:predicted Rossmann fold flavoprotein
MVQNKIRIAVIGGGAAGFFAALSAKQHDPTSELTIYEKSAKLLAKVKISGGGRCNVTNACFDNPKLSSFYPRGGRQLRKAFEQFNAKSTMDWFAERGVPLRVMEDNCVFPKSNSSQTIIDVFMEEAVQLGVGIMMQSGINGIQRREDGSFELIASHETFLADKVIVTTGGHPKRESLLWLERLGHNIIDPLPSLFTFNMPQDPVCVLMGNVVDKVTVKIEGTKLSASGPLLITHWGMSGPAVLKLSAWGARILADKGYLFAILVNWLNDGTEEKLRQQMVDIVAGSGAKMMVNCNPFSMTNRLWIFLLEKSDIKPEMRWRDLGKKGMNRLVNTLLNDRYPVSGKTTFKEEFVTAGGVALGQVDFASMESKVIPGLFFAGEVLDVDGVTGGFSFQAAWTTGWIAGKNAVKS